MKHIKAGFSRKVISPEKGISLAGYFNDRYNKGIHDDLYAKAMVLSDGDTTTAIIVVDNCLVFRPVVEKIRKVIASEAGIPEKNIWIQATHTHTAPVLSKGVWVDFSPAYLVYFVKQAVDSVLEAKAVMQPVTFAIAEGKEDRVAFCRRYIMRDGTVVTNPAKNSPDIVKPEGLADHYIAVVAIKDLSGKIIGVLVHCTNHVDSIGGDLVSADWPGVLCKYLTDMIDTHPQSILLNGMAGNINHSDINDLQQADFSEVETARIGTIYGEAAMKLLKTKLQPLEVSGIGIGHSIVDLPRLKLTEQQVDEARAILEKTSIPDSRPFLHSADLAKNNETVKALFAQKQLEFAREGKSSDSVEVSAMRIGELLVVGLPFEAFSEIGMEIKKRSPFKYTFPLGLLNGAYGYLGTKEAAERPGGMETFPGVVCLRRFVSEAALMLTDAAEELAKLLLCHESH